MKKIIITFLLILTSISLVGCGSSYDEGYDYNGKYNDDYLYEGYSSIVENVVYQKSLDLDYVIATEVYSEEEVITIKSSIIIDNLTFPVKEIGVGFLNKNSSTKKIIIEEGITKIDDYAFDKARLEEILLPSTLTEIGKEAFSYNSFKTISIPGGVNVISEGVFANCDYLENVTLSNNVSRIEDFAFENCYSLTNFKFPSELLYIGKSAFENCNSIEEIVLNDKILRVEEKAFSNISITKIVFPESVVYVGDNVFLNCLYLEDCTLGSGVTIIGETIFYGCPNILKITLNGDYFMIDSKDGWNCGFTFTFESNGQIYVENN